MGFLFLVPNSTWIHNDQEWSHGFVSHLAKYEPAVRDAFKERDLLIFTGRNEVVAKVIFLHLFVILFTGGGGGIPQGTEADPPASIPPRTRYPPGPSTPPGPDPPTHRPRPGTPRTKHTPQDQTPPTTPNQAPPDQTPPHTAPDQAPPGPSTPPGPDPPNHPQPGIPRTRHNPPGPGTPPTPLARADPPPGPGTPPPPPLEADSSILSTSGRYASYWNAFLL